MIVHRSMNRPRPVYVVNSRLPVYKVTYGDGLGDVVTGLFTRIAPKILPIGKEVASKTIGVLKDKLADNIGTSVFNVAKDKLLSLIKRKKSIKLQSTNEMPSQISKEINELAKQKLGEIVGSGLKRL
jgi:hypothetical protein